MMIEAEHLFLLARVATGRAEGVKLVDGGFGHSRFLSQLAQGTSLGTLVYFEISAWKSPMAFVWFESTLNEQHFELVVVQGEDDTVGGNGRVGVFVLVHFDDMIKNFWF